MRAKSRSNGTIECMRFLCCVAILFIHCGFPLPQSMRGHTMAIARFAVPFLILLSGWYTDRDRKSSRARKKLRDTVRVVWIGGVICILWNCWNSWMKTGEWLNWIFPYWNYRTLLDFLLFNRAVFINSVFYYFFIMIYVYAIFIATQHLKLTRLLNYISPILLFIGIYICEFSKWPWYYGGNFLFLGLPMFMLGRFLRQFAVQLARLRTKEWLLFVIGVVTTVLEFRVFGSHYLYLGAIIIALSALFFCVNHETLQCPQLLVFAGTVLSLPVIVIHCEVKDTVQILWHLGQYAMPIAVLFISILLSLLYQKIRRRF